MYLGPERADDESDMRGVISNIVVWTPLPDTLPELQLMGNYDYGWDSDAGAKVGNEPWWGYALYARYQATDKLSYVVRYEFFTDEEGVRVPFATNDAVDLWEISVGAEYKLYNNPLTRVEYRHDESSEATFQSDATGGMNSQNTIAAKLIYTFG
jgi:predicted porin